MLTREEDIDAHALRRRGWSISAIARHLGRDRKTIRAYLNGELVGEVRVRRAKRVRRGGVARWRSSSTRQAKKPSGTSLISRTRQRRGVGAQRRRYSSARSRTRVSGAPAWSSRPISRMSSTVSTGSSGRLAGQRRVALRSHGHGLSPRQRPRDRVVHALGDLQHSGEHAPSARERRRRGQQLRPAGPQ